MVLKVKSVAKCARSILLDVREKYAVDLKLENKLRDK